MRLKMEKTKVIYNKYDPNNSSVVQVAIQSYTNPPYIFGVYDSTVNENALRDTMANEGVIVIPIASARRLFNFQKVDGWYLEEMLKEDIHK